MRSQKFSAHFSSSSLLNLSSNNSSLSLKWSATFLHMSCSRIDERMTNLPSKGSKGRASMTFPHQDSVRTAAQNRTSASLQNVRGFCRQAATQGFDWVWGDTCCIDQTSSADVSESISTMFSWYRGSALTIIYLSDVATSNVQALLRSQRFRRGWTLQELLAANVIQIYKRDWSPFSPVAFNHKDDSEILAALESAT